jgi:two-component system chemotaxis response regulator CheB
MGCELVVLGASWGGLEAVGTVLEALPADFGAPVLVVQHRSEDGGDVLAELLDRRVALPVHDAEDKADLSSACVLVAPRGYHVLVEHGHVELSTEEAVRHSRPSIDVALESAADAYGPSLIGVVMTGANDDGARGLAAIRAAGGLAAVQDPDEAAHAKMPAAAIAAACPDYVLPLAGLRCLLHTLVRP